MFSLFRSQGNEHENCFEISLYSSQIGYHQENKKQQMSTWMQGKRTSYSMVVEMRISEATMEISNRCSVKTKTKTT
jgi:hypothetical protein